MASPKRGIPDGTTLRTSRRSAGVLSAAVTGPLTAPPSEIALNPNNPPRRREADIEVLARSVATQGVLTPLLLCRAEEWLDRFPQHADEIGDATWVALDGDRRLTAARLNPETVQRVPYYERSIKELDDTLVRLHTGSTALRLTPIEDAVQLRRLMDEHRWNQTEVAHAVGVSQSHVAKRLQLLTLPVAVQKAIEDGRATIGEALALAGTRSDVDGKTVRDEDLIDRVAELLTSTEPGAAPSEADGDTEAGVDPEEQQAPVSLAQLRETAERQRHQEAAEQIARARAKELGALFAHDPREHISDQFGFAHRIHKTDNATLRRAAKDRNLLVTPSTASRDTAPQYWHLRAPESVVDESAQERSRRAAKLAKDARWQAVSSAADYTPSADLLREMLVETMLISVERLPDLARLVRKLAREHQLAEDSADWAGQLAATDSPSQVAWVVALAHREAHLRATDRWTPSDVSYIGVLTDVTGYTPTEWEKARMEEVPK